MCESFHNRVDLACGDEVQCRPVQLEVPLLKFRDPPLKLIEVEFLLFQQPPEARIKHKLRSTGKGFRQGDTKLIHDVHGRVMALVYLSEVNLHLFQRTFLNKVQNLNLLVPEQIPEGKIVHAEVRIHQADDPGDIGFKEGVLQFPVHDGKRVVAIKSLRPSVQVIVSEIQDRKVDNLFFQRNVRLNSGPADGKFLFPDLFFFVYLAFNRIAVYPGGLRIFLKEGGNGVVCTDPAQVGNQGSDKQLISPCTVFDFRDVARRLLECLDKGILQVFTAYILGKLHGAGGVLNNLCRFDTRNVLKEPPAARVHEHGVTLHLKKFKNLYLLFP